MAGLVRGPKNLPALFEVKVLRNGRRSPRVAKGFYCDQKLERTISFHNTI